jgi:hypothetical protein
MHKRNICQILFACLFGISAANAQNFNSIPRIVTEEINCSDREGQSRSLALASPGRKNRAWVELGTTATLSKSAKECHLKWDLQISTNWGKKFREVSISTRDVDDEMSSEFEIVGWNRDGTKLLVTQIQWAGDYTRHTPVIYDLSANRFKSFDLEKLFESITRNCPLLQRPAGFLPDGSLGVLTDSLEDLDPGQRPCMPPSLWSLNLTTQHLNKISKRETVTHAGSISWADSPKMLVFEGGAGSNSRNPQCGIVFSKTIRFDPSIPAVPIEWRRCGESHQRGSTEWPTDQINIMKSGSEFKSMPGDEKVVLQHLVNKTGFNDLDQMYVASIDVHPPAGGEKQYLVITTKYYGSGEGTALCILGKTTEGLNCLQIPDLNLAVQKLLESDEDFCCTDWWMSANGPEEITLEHDVFEKKTHQRRESIKIDLKPTESSLAILKVRR